MITVLTLGLEIRKLDDLLCAIKQINTIREEEKHNKHEQIITYQLNVIINFITGMCVITVQTPMAASTTPSTSNISTLPSAERSRRRGEGEIEGEREGDRMEDPRSLMATT